LKVQVVLAPDLDCRPVLIHKLGEKHTAANLERPTIQLARHLEVLGLPCTARRPELKLEVLHVARALDSDVEVVEATMLEDHPPASGATWALEGRSQNL